MIRRLLAVTLFMATGAMADRDFRRGPSRHNDPVAQTIRDLEMVWQRSRVDHHERDHFRRAIEDLQRFQYKASRGDYDRGRLGRAIDNIEDLAQADQIHPQFRRILKQRLYQLRSFREDLSSRRYYGYRR